MHRGAVCDKPGAERARRHIVVLLVRKGLHLVRTGFDGSRLAVAVHIRVVRLHDARMVKEEFVAPGIP